MYGAPCYNKQLFLIFFSLFSPACFITDKFGAAMALVKTDIGGNITVWISFCKITATLSMIFPFVIYFGNAIIGSLAFVEVTLVHIYKDTSVAWKVNYTSGGTCRVLMSCFSPK